MPIDNETIGKEQDAGAKIARWLVPSNLVIEHIDAAVIQSRGGTAFLSFFIVDPNSTAPNPDGSPIQPMAICVKRFACELPVLRTIRDAIEEHLALANAG